MGEFERNGRELWVGLIGLALAVAGAWFILWTIKTEHWWTTLLKWVFALSVGPVIGIAVILGVSAMGWALIAPLVRWCKGWRR